MASVISLFLKLMLTNTIGLIVSSKHMKYRPLLYHPGFKSLQQLGIVSKIKPQSLHTLVFLFPCNFPVLVKLISSLCFRHPFTLPHLFIIFFFMEFSLSLLIELLKLAQEMNSDCALVFHKVLVSLLSFCTLVYIAYSSVKL